MYRQPGKQKHKHADRPTHTHTTRRAHAQFQARAPTDTHSIHNQTRTRARMNTIVQTMAHINNQGHRQQQEQTQTADQNELPNWQQQRQFWKCRNVTRPEQRLVEGHHLCNPHDHNNSNTERAGTNSNNAPTHNGNPNNPAGRTMDAPTVVEIRQDAQSTDAVMRATRNTTTFATTTVATAMKTNRVRIVKRPGHVLHSPGLTRWRAYHAMRLGGCCVPCKSATTRPRRTHPYILCTPRCS